MQQIQYYSLTDQVYDALKRDIVRRKLAANAKLDVNGLATTLGISRMPVVDALTRLESEGLVEKRNRVGTFVTPVSQAKFREWFEVRGMIEDWATPRIIERASDPDFAALESLLTEAREVLRKANARSFDLNHFNEQYDFGFHRGLIGLAGNGSVTETYAALHVRTRIGRSFVDMPIKREGDAQDYHEMILKAFKSRNATKAIWLQKEHREDSLGFTLKQMKEREIF
jgi:DNA-binding GntR family transcriptional regulator